MFNLYAEYIMRNARMAFVSCKQESRIIKVAGRNISNLRYANDTTLMAQSKELKSLLMRVKK